MGEPMRVGVIGTGAIARAHVLGYEAAGAEIVALCDVNPAVLAERQASWRIANGYTSYEELLADERIEAVSICTPNASHHPITLAAAAAGKHVLCEKPVSLDLAQAQEMIDACARAGVTLQVGHHLRSFMVAAKAKEMIAAGAIGEVSYARFRQAHDWGGSRQPRGAFGSREQSGGGTLLDNGCHLFDLARFLGGNVRDVFARVATLKFDVEVEDTAISSLGYTSGAMGQVEVAWTSTGWQEAFWLWGTEGSLEFDNRVSQNLLIHRSRVGAGQEWADSDVTRYEMRGLPAHSEQVANFFAAIRGERDVVCSGADGLEAVRLVLASYQSADRGSPVIVG